MCIRDSFVNGALLNSAVANSIALASGDNLSDISDDPTVSTDVDPNADGNPDDPSTLTFGSNISGSVYTDSNGNGVRDPGEPGILGVEIIVTGTTEDGAPISTSVFTDANGNYTFEDLPAGTYTITQVQPTQFLDGPDQLGSLGGTQSNDSFTITLSPGSGDGFGCLLYTSPSPRDATLSRMPSSA